MDYLTKFIAGVAAKGGLRRVRKKKPPLLSRGTHLSLDQRHDSLPCTQPGL